ncbi:MAG: MFS transporter [Candidatus Rokubacteria bacterium]|nr:MFS transporter [Candidatus Rokubacteria bacterium]
MPAILNYPLFVRATATNFFFFAGMNCFLLLPLYIQGLGGTTAEIGVIMGLYSFAGIICQPVLGPWVDAFGRRPFMRFGTTAVVATALLALVTSSMPVLALLRLLQGLGFSAFFVANYTMAIDLVPPERRGWALGIYGVSGLCSTAIAPLAGEWTVRHFGFPWLFLLAAALSSVAVALVWRIPEQRRRIDAAPGRFPALRLSAGDVLQRHIGITLFFGLGTGAIFTFMPTFAESLGVTTLSLFYTGYAGAAALVRVTAGGLIDSRGRRAVIVPSMLVQAMSTAILAALGLLIGPGTPVPVVPFLFLAGFLAGGAHGFLYPGLAALVTDTTPPARRGAVIGIFSAAVLSGNALGAFVFGYVAHWLGYGPMWTILALILTFGFGLSGKLEEVPARVRSEVASS